MPQIKYYRVTQTREIRVEAQDPLSAAHIAQTVFDAKEMESPVYTGGVASQVNVRDLEIREDY